MSVEAIPDAIHEYMYEKLNESPGTDEEKKIRLLDKRKLRNNKEPTERYSKGRQLDGNKCGTQLVQTAGMCRKWKEMPKM